jgi:hypothetical protein
MDESMYLQLEKNHSITSEEAGICNGQFKNCGR